MNCNYKVYWCLAAAALAVFFSWLVNEEIKYRYATFREDITVEKFFNGSQHFDGKLSFRDTFKTETFITQLLCVARHERFFNFPRDIQTMDRTELRFRYTAGSPSYKSISANLSYLFPFMTGERTIHRGHKDKCIADLTLVDSMKGEFVACTAVRCDSGKMTEKLFQKNDEDLARADELLYERVVEVEKNNELLSKMAHVDGEKVMTEEL